jgi:hypothetical protein
MDATAPLAALPLVLALCYGGAPLFILAGLYAWLRAGRLVGTGAVLLISWLWVLVQQIAPRFFAFAHPVVFSEGNLSHIVAILSVCFLGFARALPVIPVSQNWLLLLSTMFASVWLWQLLHSAPIALLLLWVGAIFYAFLRASAAALSTDDVEVLPLTGVVAGLLLVTCVATDSPTWSTAAATLPFVILYFVLSPFSVSSAPFPYLCLLYGLLSWPSWPDVQPNIALAACAAHHWGIIQGTRISNLITLALCLLWTCTPWLSGGKDSTDTAHMGDPLLSLLFKSLAVACRGALLAFHYHLTCQPACLSLLLLFSFLSITLASVSLAWTAISLAACGAYHYRKALRIRARWPKLFPRPAIVTLVVLAASESLLNSLQGSLAVFLLLLLLLCLARDRALLARGGAAALSLSALACLTRLLGFFSALSLLAALFWTTCSFALHSETANRAATLRAHLGVLPASVS